MRLIAFESPFANVLKKTLHQTFTTRIDTRQYGALLTAMKITSVNDSKLARAEDFVREYLIQLANILKEQNGKGSLVRVYLAHLQRKTTEMDQGNHNRRKQISEPIKTHNKQSSKKCYLH